MSSTRAYTSPGRTADADPFRGEVPRDDVAALLAAVLAEPRSVGATLYANAGEDPIERALAALL